MVVQLLKPEPILKEKVSSFCGVTVMRVVPIQMANSTCSLSHG